MKVRLTAMICVLLCMLHTPAFCQSAEHVLRQAHPRHAFEEFKACGNTAAAVAVYGEERRLLIAQHKNGRWVITIDSPNALGGAVDALTLEREDRISWTYKDKETYRTRIYSAEYTGGEWGALQIDDLYAYEYFSSASSVTWRDGCIVTESWSWHDADPARSARQIMPVPARWMEEKVKLAQFDLDDHLYSNGLDHDWLSREVVQRAAAELLPDYAFIDGNAQYDGLLLLMGKKDGTRVFVGCTYDPKKGFVLCESAPLPKDVQCYIGYENFTSALVLHDPKAERSTGIPLQLAPYADGTWGVRYNVNFIAPMLGRYHLKDDNGRYTFGTHPWSDVRSIDWEKLPQTIDQMKAGLDTHGWATPNSANPEDRLHLRAAPRKDAVSLGKYYNGAPVEVLERMGDWSHVRVLGIEGYMMTKYLVFGEDVADVVQRVDTYLLTGEKAALYARTKDEAPVCMLRESPAVVGVLGEQWYHVWDPESGLSGFVRQEDLWPGNG